MVVLPGTPATPLRTCSSPHLLDHLVRLEQERWGHGEAKRLGGLEIDHHDQLRRELHWQVTRRRAMQDFVHVCGGAATAPALIDAVADQPAGIDIFAISEDGCSRCAIANAAMCQPSLRVIVVCRTMTTST